MHTGAPRNDLAAPVDSAATVETLYVAGRAHWPALQVSQEQFQHYLMARAPTAAHGWSLDSAADLYLACACSNGDPAAYPVFVQTYEGLMRGALRHISGLSHELDDAVQLAMHRLLLSSEEGAPKIVQYSGRSELASFVRVVATRVALSMTRKNGRQRTAMVGLGSLEPGEDDPELRYLKDLYREEFRAAFSAAVAQIPARDRSILRYQLVVGLGIAELAAIYKRPRSTIGRHLLEARARLINETHVVLRTELKVTQNELSSILRLVRSSVDVSVKRLLSEPDQ